MYAAFDIHLVPVNELLKECTHIPCTVNNQLLSS